MVTHKLDNWCTMHTAVVCAVWLTQAQSLSLCSDQVLQLWKDFGRKDNKEMLDSLKVLAQLESQVYGPTTHLIASDVSVLPLCLIQFVQLCYYHQIALIAKPLIIQLV